MADQKRICTFFKCFVLGVVVGFGVFFAGCQDKDDYLFDYKYVEELYDKTFPVKNIDPSQDWKTTSIIDVNVLVNQDFGETYKLTIYSANPLNDQHARVLGKGSVENGVTFSIKIDSPKGRTTIFISCMDSKNRMVIQQYSVETGKVNAVFGSEVRSGRAVARGNGNGYSISRESIITDDDINNVRENGLKITDELLGVWGKENKNGEIKEDFHVAEGTTVTKLMTYYLAPGNKKRIIVVDGTWSLSDLDGLPDGGALVVVGPTGTINISGMRVGLNMDKGNSCIIVLPGGNLSVIGGSVSIQGSASMPSIYNAGTFTIADDGMLLSSSKGNNGAAFIYNAENGTALLEDMNNNLNITNWGSMNIGSGDTSRNYVFNACHLTVERDLGVKHLILDSNSRVDVKGNLNMASGGNGLEMGNFSVINANSLTLGQTVKVSGNDISDYAVLKMGTLNVEKHQLQFDKSKVYVDWNPANFSGNGIDKTIEDISYWTSQLNTSLLIPAGDCTGDGYEPPVGPIEPPKDDDITQQGESYICCYEDYFPSPGDYDFNDVVMGLNYNVTKTNGVVTDLDVEIELKAVGATYQLGAALQLVGISQTAIISKTVEDNGRTSYGGMFDDNETGIDGAPIIPLFGDAHYMLTGSIGRNMYNTGLADVSPQTISIHLEFDETAGVDDITLDNMDLFVARSLPEGAYYAGNEGKDRIEIHLYNFWEQKSPRAVYFIENEIAAKNRTWAISVPSFYYPLERVSITDAYPEFELWAADKNSYADWYENYIEGKVYK